MERTPSPEFHVYSEIIKRCLTEDPVCTPALQKELSVLSLQKIYVICEIYDVTSSFWEILSAIFEMLHRQVRRNGLRDIRTLTIKFQNLEDQYPHLFSEFSAVCFHAFDKVEPDITLTVLLYNKQYSHRLQLHVTHPASAFCIHVLPKLKEKIRLDINMIVTTHPQWQNFALSGQHYLSVVLYFMGKYLYYSSSVK